MRVIEILCWFDVRSRSRFNRKSLYMSLLYTKARLFLNTKNASKIMFGGVFFNGKCRARRLGLSPEKHAVNVLDEIEISASF